MAYFVQNHTALDLALALFVLWRLPLWGSRVLAFLRDLRDFLDGF